MYPLLKKGPLSSKYTTFNQSMGSNNKTVGQAKAYPTVL